MNRRCATYIHAQRASTKTLWGRQAEGGLNAAGDQLQLGLWELRAPGAWGANELINGFPLIHVPRTNFQNGLNSMR